MQQAVLKPRTGDGDVVSQMEAALETTPRDALEQHFTGRSRSSRFFAFDSQHILGSFNDEIIIAKSGNSERNAEGILCRAFDVVG